MQNTDTCIAQLQKLILRASCGINLYYKTIYPFHETGTIEIKINLTAVSFKPWDMSLQQAYQ